MTDLEKRATDRITILGTQVLCARRGFFGWKTTPVPFHVRDIGLNGMSFRNFSDRIEPGTQLKLTILLPKSLPIHVKGEVVWNHELAEIVSNGLTQRTHVCGVRFIDFEADAWTTLSNVLTAARTQPEKKKRRERLASRAGEAAYSSPQKAPTSEIAFAEESGAQISLA